MLRSSLVSRLSRFEHPLVLGAYTLIALVMSYPLAAQFDDHIAGVDGDVWSYLGAMGWARVSLLNLGVNPFHTDYIFYPLGGATQLLWGTALPSFASIPLQLAFGLVPAFNLMYLAASGLTGYGMYLLAKQELGNSKFQNQISTKFDFGILNGAAFLSGVIFAFGALRIGYGLAFTNLFHTEFMPFYVLFLLRATRTRKWKDAILAGFFFALNVYVDFQIAAFLAVLTGVWFLFVLARAFIRRDPKGFSRERDSTRARGENPLGLVTRWLLTIVVAAILSLPMLAFILQDFAIEGGNYIRVYPLKYSAERSYDLLSFVIPNARSTFYQNVAPRVEGVNASVNTEGESELSPDRQAFLGVTVLILALIGAIRFRRALLFWIFVTLIFATLSLGPVLHIAGNNTNIPLPFVLVNNIPILNHIRIPMRYGLMVFLGASFLAGAGALVLLSWKRWLILPLTALILIEAAMLPYPTLEFHVPRVYDQIARETGDFTILEIPSFYWRDAAKNGTYQAIHQKRILRAYTNRITPDVADYFNLRQTPIVVRSLRILEGAEQGILTKEEIEQDRAVLNDTVNFFNLRYAILHHDQLDVARAAQIDTYLRDVLHANRIYQDADISVYQFAATPNTPQALDLDLADNASLMYLGRGWQIEPFANVEAERGRYMKRDTSEIYVPLRALASGNLHLRVLNENNPTNLFFAVNGKRLNGAAVREGWQTLALVLPRGFVDQTLNLFHIQTTDAPATIAVGFIESE